MFSKEGERMESEEKKWTGKSRRKRGREEYRKKRGRVRAISYTVTYILLKDMLDQSFKNF